MSQAYIITSQVVPKTLYSRVEWLFTDAEAHFNVLSADSKRLFKHILVCTLVSPDDVVWVPVSARLLKEKLPKARWKELVEAHLVEASEYDAEKGLSRRFCLTFHALDSLAAALPGSTYSVDEERVDLFSGKRVTKAVASTTRYDNGSRYPAAWVETMKLFNGTVINRSEIEAHLAEREAAAKRAYGSPEYPAALKRLAHDRFCLWALATQDLKPRADGLYEFVPAFSASDGGRFFQIGGGIQGASGEMKAAAYSGVPEVHNYDIKSSQMYCLRSQFEQANLAGAGLDDSWVRHYIQTPEAKHVYAERVGVPAEVWKDCLYALVMGAGVGESGSVVRILAGAVADESEFTAAHRSFKRVTAPLRHELGKWHSWLLAEYLPRHSAVEGGRVYVPNVWGGKYHYGEDLAKDSRLCVRKLVAHLLQGQEGFLVSRILYYGKLIGVQPQMHEHDGLVASGVIPPEVFARAGAEAGIPDIVVVEKPFKAKLVA